jgi:hypothetical protein
LTRFGSFSWRLPFAHAWRKPGYGALLADRRWGGIHAHGQLSFLLKASDLKTEALAYQIF